MQRSEVDIYNGIEELPIWNFKQIENTGNFVYMLKDWNYSKPFKFLFDIEKEWEPISEYYITNMASDMYEDFKKSVIQIEAKKREFIFLRGCIHALTIDKKPELIERIKLLGYQFNNNTETEYYQSLIDLTRQIKALSKVIDQKSNEFTTKFKKEESKKDELEETLTCLSKHFGFILNSKTLTVSQYIAYYKSYQQYQKENQENENTHGRRNN